MLKLGFLASNNGTSFRAIHAAIEAGTLDAEARLVVSNKKDSGALAYAEAHGAPARWIAASQDAQLAAALAEAGVELVILSGYLRKLGPVTLAAYRHRVLNIHPALLPLYGGEGFYGRRVHEAVAAAGDAESGVTIHLVDGEYDHGPHLAQKRVPLAPGDDAETIERKVVSAEAPFFVETLQKIASGAIKLPPTP